MVDQENIIGKAIVDCAYRVHVALGPGLFEVVYEIALAHELQQRGFKIARQVPIPITYDGIEFREGFRADLIVADMVLVEIKSVETIHKVHKKQVLTYLKLANLRLGYLVNFGEHLIKNGLTRVANGVQDLRRRHSNTSV